MDVEGYEHEIIKGARRTLARCPKLKIFMEIHPHLLTDRELDVMLETLRVNGFQVSAIVNECEPHVYQFLHDKAWRRMQSVVRRSDAGLVFSRDENPRW